MAFSFCSSDMIKLHKENQRSFALGQKQFSLDHGVNKARLSSFYLNFIPDVV